MSGSPGGSRCRAKRHDHRLTSGRAADLLRHASQQRRDIGPVAVVPLDADPEARRPRRQRRYAKRVDVQLERLQGLGQRFDHRGDWLLDARRVFAGYVRYQTSPLEVKDADRKALLSAIVRLGDDDLDEVEMRTMREPVPRMASERPLLSHRRCGEYLYAVELPRGAAIAAS